MTFSGPNVPKGQVTLAGVTRGPKKAISASLLGKELEASVTSIKGTLGGNTRGRGNTNFPPVLVKVPCVPSVTRVK